jgi:hypothetical protein
MTTPESNPFKHYKHFRKAIAFRFRNLELCRHCRFQYFRPGFRFWHMYMPCWSPWLFSPKTVEITCPKWNAYKLIYTDPRLLHGNGFSGLYSQDQVHCPMQWHTQGHIFLLQWHKVCQKTRYINAWIVGP